MPVEVIGAGRGAEARTYSKAAPFLTRFETSKPVGSNRNSWLLARLISSAPWPSSLMPRLWYQTDSVSSAGSFSAAGSGVIRAAWRLLASNERERGLVKRVGGSDKDGTGGPRYTPSSPLPEASRTAVLSSSSNFQCSSSPSATQVPPLHMKPAAQPAAGVHAEAQAPAAQVKAPHSLRVLAWQMPRPSQIRLELAALALQVAAAHSVPAACTRQRPAPSHAPSRPQLLAASGLQRSPGSSPAGASEQVPTLPASVHDTHAWSQTTLQQTPPLQTPVAHCPGVVQGWPSGRLSRHDFSSQKNPGKQSSALAQAVAHDPFWQVVEVQARVALARQTPLPSHRRADRSLVPWQPPGSHSVVAGYRRQPPLPSQVPSRPQVTAGSVVHSLRRSSPAGLGMQVPADPAALHTEQRSVQALLQQIPSAQKLEVHSLAGRAGRAGRFFAARAGVAAARRIGVRRRRGLAARRRHLDRRCRARSRPRSN